MELRQLGGMTGQVGRPAQRQRRFQIGFDDVGRRRQDIGDQIAAELDLGVERTADPQLLQRQRAGGQHRREPTATVTAKTTIIIEMERRTFIGLS